MKIFDTILEILTAPFNFLLRANAMPTPKKNIHQIWILLMSLVIVVLLVFLAYYEVFIHA